jgi:hypothetical protein
LNVCYWRNKIFYRRCAPFFYPISISHKKAYTTCLHGYLLAVRTSDPAFYHATVKGFLSSEENAWLGATIALRSDYDDDLFVQCLDALEKRLIDPQMFEMLRFGKTIESVPPERTERLLHQLNAQDALFLLVELLESLPFNDTSPFNSDFVFHVLSRSVPGKEKRDVMRGYNWKNVCLKLIKWDGSRALPLLDVLLTEMGKEYRLSYDHDIAPLATELARSDPSGAWKIVRVHLEEALPTWRIDILHWLKGGISGFEEESTRGAIVDLPMLEIIEWIEEDPDTRALLMAHGVPGTLDDEKGGRLTRELLHRYGERDDVKNEISATFHSGGWTGPTSAYLKRKREKLRRWLSAGFEIEVTQWIEREIEYLDRNIEREEINEERERFD